MEQENKTQALQKNKNGILSLDEISKNPALITGCKQITKQVEILGEEVVLTEIRISLERLALGFGIELDKDRTALICCDILEAYKYKSIEDVQICLKKARQGVYDWGHEKRGVINMSVISHWMKKYQREKAAQIEKKNKEQSKPGTDELWESHEAYMKMAKESSKRQALKAEEEKKNRHKKILDQDKYEEIKSRLLDDEEREKYLADLKKNINKKGN
jgi:hypothetical protein